MTLTPLIVRAWATKSSSFESAPLRFRDSSCFSSWRCVCSVRSMAAARLSSFTPRRAADLAEELARALVIGERGSAGDGFDAAHSGGGGLFDGNLEDADIAGAAHVRAAAKLLAVKAARRGGIGNRHDAHVLLGIAVAEESQRAGSERVVNRGDVGLRFRS